MRKITSLLLVLAVLLTAIPAFAQGYTSHMGNVATFETLEEARVNGCEAMTALKGGAYAAHPALATYPAGTTYVYRSADMFGSIRAAYKLNTNLVVFTPEVFADKDEAFAYLNELGLPALIEKVTGSVVLVSPVNAEAGFGAADLNAFKNLETAMTAQASGGVVDGARVTYADGEYYGVYGYQYVIGIGSGATFVNNQIATSTDLVGRIAGLLLIGGSIQNYRHIATPVPAYLVNADAAVVEAYKAINDVDASSFDRNSTTYFNQVKPVQMVKVAKNDAVATKDAIEDAFINMFCKVMRISADGGKLPFSLTKRAAIIDEMTDLGVQVKFHMEDRFIDVKTAIGDYLESWYECLPQEVVDGTAAPGTIPLILALHGMGDDPLMFIDGNGFVQLAGEERVAVVAPEHQDVFWVSQNGQTLEGIELVVMPMLVEYMLDTYPALDATRVYVSGYSMGGWATMKSLHGKPELFAAAAPMSGMTFSPSEEQAAQFEKLDMPAMISTSVNDMGMLFDSQSGTLQGNHRTLLNLFLNYNEMPAIEEFDFDAYPMCGFPSDSGKTVTFNGEYINHRWFMHNDQDIPMVGLAITEDLTHSLYPEFAHLMWDFVSHYSRDVETYEITYRP